MAEGNTDRLQIESIVAGGDGIARRGDGCVVFVPRTAPGETVDVEYTESRRQWSRARVTHIVAASKSRRDPPCPHYARCGGCQLQHLGYDAQLAVKSAVVSESFKRIGGIDVPPPEVVASPREFGYRNRVSLAARQGISGLVAGYHGVDDPAQVVDIDRCPLAEDPVGDVLVGLRDAWRDAPQSIPRGRELRLTIRVNADGDAALAVEGARDPGRPEDLLARVDGLRSIWIVDHKGAVVRTAGEKTLDERWGARVIPLAGTAFVQVNRDVAALLDAETRAACGDVSGRRVVDAYCGFGLRTIELAAAGAEAVGIERDRHAVAAARGMAAAPGESAGSARSARFIAGDVERALPRELPADVVVVNPPRRGVTRPVIDALSRSSAELVVYISCDPATLARDVKALAGVYQLRRVRSFDLFPQTAHVETVAVLSRSA